MEVAPLSTATAYTDFTQSLEGFPVIHWLWLLVLGLASLSVSLSLAFGSTLPPSSPLPLSSIPLSAVALAHMAETPTSSQHGQHEQGERETESQLGFVVLVVLDRGHTFNGNPRDYT